ncbi:uncharacterized protein ARMOST_08179 [Armillaria ostoyae]|uniref:Uncharacterized protein n=1 Tax=Armillaria ostoyae TaxID=47428 RepID=A0A284R7W8_ARMOS|nr:uncharacterized protein ARMOST_08179 [Armillaria ostoyae]
MQPLAISLPPTSATQSFPVALEQSRLPTRSSQRVMELQRNSTSDIDSMLSGRAPMPMHLRQPRPPPASRGEDTRVQGSRAKTIAVYEDAEPPPVSRPALAPPPPVSPPPAPVAQLLPQAPPSSYSPL